MSIAKLSGKLISINKNSCIIDIGEIFEDIQKLNIISGLSCLSEYVGNNINIEFIFRKKRELGRKSFFYGCSIYSVNKIFTLKNCMEQIIFNNNVNIQKELLEIEYAKLLNNSINELSNFIDKCIFYNKTIDDNKIKEAFDEKIENLFNALDFICLKHLNNIINKDMFFELFFNHLVLFIEEFDNYKHNNNILKVIKLYKNEIKNVIRKDFDWSSI